MLVMVSNSKFYRYLAARRCLHLSTASFLVDYIVFDSGTAHFHTVGTCAPGRVLNVELHVNGVQGLRVGGANVPRSPVGRRLQANLYRIRIWLQRRLHVEWN